MSLEMTGQTDRTRMVIDLTAVRKNYGTARSLFPGKKIMTVMKNDAYGYGIAGMAATCEEYTDQFAVATYEEGKALRDAGCKKPVLIFNPVPRGRIADTARERLTFSVGSLEYALLLQTELLKAGLSAACHLKIDTGFNRTGFRMREESEDLCMQKVLYVYKIPNLTVKGMYTHLPVGDSEEASDREFTARQLRRFDRAVELVQKAGLDPGLRHVFATDSGLFHRDENPYEMVRMGMLIHGNCAAVEKSHELGLQQIEQWTTNITQLENVAPGEDVGYGRTFTAARPTRLAVLSVGYGDGYRRQYGGMEVLCGGKRVPIIGRICMDSMMIDVTDVEEPYVGMEVVLLGQQLSEDGEEMLEIRPMELAARFDSTSGEVTGAISARVPRYYINE